MVERQVSEVFREANILEAVIKHNGICGGDSSHGGYVQLWFKNHSSTDMSVNGEWSEKIVLTFRGDSERSTLLKALKLFVKELEENK